MNDKLTIGMVADLLGVHKDTIRQWELQKKIKLTRNKKNNYRECKMQEFFRVKEWFFNGKK